ncbi:MAG: PLDc N-terminal domain-containing protein [Thermoleophilia bacterium]
MSNRRWSELSPRERVVVVALAVVQLSLLAAAWADIRRRPAEQIRGGKARWALMSLINFAGPIAYFAAGRRRA